MLKLHQSIFNITLLKGAIAVINGSLQLSLAANIITLIIAQFLLIIYGISSIPVDE